VASGFAMEFHSRVSLLLLAFLAARFVSVYAAAAALLAGLFAMKGGPILPSVLHENDDDFQTLLFYLVLSLSAIFVLVGWLG